MSKRSGCVMALAAALLLTLALVPLLSALGIGIAGAPRSFAFTQAHAGVSSTPSPTGTFDPHSMDWMSALGAAAQTAYVNSIIAHMTLDEELGQMLVAGVDGTHVDSDLIAKIQRYHVGGLILYGNNVVSARQLRTLTQQAQAKATIPLMIQIDQEGGTVNRLTAIEGTGPSAEQIGATNDPAVAQQRGLADGQQLSSLGINVNLAPVVDVQSLPDGHGAMAYRMFGETPDQVTKMAGAYLQGLQQGGHVVGTLKHFPGLGSIDGDPHLSAVYLNRTIDQLEAVDWAPYRALLATCQVGMIMTTHVTLTKVDPTTPTTLSYAVTTGMLRQRLGFNGVIVTDDLYMAALRDYYTYPREVTMAVLAGNDLISSTYTLAATKGAMSVLQDDVARGAISKERIDESVRRILLLKLRYGILPPPSSP